MKTVRQVVDFLEAFGEVVGDEGLSNETGAEILCHLSEQSGEVEEGTLFVAKQGATVDALDFVPDRGRWVLIERAQSPERRQKVRALRARGVFVFEVMRLGALLAALADWFYDSPSRQLKVVGVTGTNGKSSTTFYAAQLLMHQGFQVGIMGTLGVGVFPQLRPSANTTLEGVSLQRSLAEFVRAGVHFVLMEVSSHAVALGRIVGVVFETLALTQVSSDHLDFHQTQADYEAAKLALFERWPSRGYVINAADGVGRRAVKFLQAHKEEGGEILTYSALAQVEAALRCVQPVFSAQGVSGQLAYRAEVCSCRVPLWGAFNIENVLCAVGIVLQQGIAFDQGVSGLPYLSAVPGRMQVLAQKPTVILDYAHTADGLLQVLKAVRLHFSQNEGRLWLVFGCGGERDREKRPQMGAVALRYADRVVITNDNPRCEAPVCIVKDILSGMVDDDGVQMMQCLEGERWTTDFERFLQQYALENVTVILDRAQAISEAIAAADEKDVVLVVGKGHETTQVFCEEVLPFSDADVVAGLLGRG